MNVTNLNRVLFSKQNVFIYPPEIEKGLNGTISISSIDKGSIYLMWTPLPSNEQEDAIQSATSPSPSPSTSLNSSRNIEILDNWNVKVHVKELKSIKKYTPTIGTPYIILNTKKNITVPPFFFEQGGVRELLKSLGSIIQLKKSSLDSNIFNVVDFSDPLQRSISSINLSDELHFGDTEEHDEDDSHGQNQQTESNSLRKAQIIVPQNNNNNSGGSNGNSPKISYTPPRSISPPISIGIGGNSNLLPPTMSPSSVGGSGFSMSPTSKLLSSSMGSDSGNDSDISSFNMLKSSSNAVLSTSPNSNLPNKRTLKKEKSSNIFDNFAKISQLAKSAQKNIFEETGKKIDNHFRNLLNKDTKPNQSTSSILGANLANSGTGQSGNSLSNSISPQKNTGGNSSSNYNSIFEQLNDSMNSLGSSMDYFTPFNISSSNFSVELTLNRKECNPLSPSEWYSYFDEEGRICLANQQILLKKIFYGGVDDSIRKEVWPYLLHYYPFDSTYSSRDVLKFEKSQEYFTIKRQWQSISCEQESRFSKYTSRKQLIRKDVIRTDRLHPMYQGDDDQNPNLQLLNDILLTYSFYNFDIGYVQGMSDLLSPILSVMENEVDSFWCLKGMMDRLESNFHKDQNGMHTQLSTLAKLLKFIDVELFNHIDSHDGSNMYFFFQSILICFKREFHFQDVKTLWEILWSNYLTKQLPIFMCLAILLQERNIILEADMSFDQILKLINQKAGKMDLDEILIDSESLVKYFIVKQINVPDQSLLSLKESVSTFY
ncbi:RabGAP/TBC domain-containing protein [Tieghemostelium lacteum]|uniref:RabGAP/TBC domain-containing protein n=1 Tax=Tieghemostelium lacteum TaxID=361077 RepID=A0A151Z3G7_TIELA|nr:RabGAP/TBC domain-containing protein [Tieghemostelium lacteum]|eukprot:KYQ88488.1 RabGAP/TBC domain-containing protein [Tieghemostelium lacteum]